MQTRNLLKIALALVAGALGTASTAWCDSFSLTLISSGGGVYDYGITVPSAITFNLDQTITLTGMSGVTAASATAILSCFTVQSFTSSSVTFAQTTDSVFCGFSGPKTWGDFIVDSTAPLGTVDWSGQASVGTFSGTVGGPVGAPEPGSLSMLLTSVVGLGALVFFARPRGVLHPSHASV